MMIGISIIVEFGGMKKDQHCWSFFMLNSGWFRAVS